MESNAYLKIIDSDIIVFQTQRMYSEHGQRIAAVELTDRRVMFYDVDRGISGITKNKFLAPAAKEQYETDVPHYDRYMYDIRSLRGFVMWQYDYGHIDYGAYDSTKKYEWEQLIDLENKLQKIALAL